jgi:hypothetical protein
MTHQMPKLLLMLTLALAMPLSARDTYSIRRALAGRDYDRALALTKREFAQARSGGEAANLIQSIIISAPAEQIAPLVVTAVEANPQFGQDILRAAIEGATPSERAAILTSARFALERNPNAPPELVEYVCTVAEREVPTHQVGTTPWFNPGASVGTSHSGTSH